MTNIKILVLMVGMGTFFSACNNEKKANEAKLNDAIALYNAADKMKDANTARVALNQILLLKPEDTKYLDSLARLYIKGGNYAGGITVAEKLIKVNKAPKELQELVGVAYQQESKLEEAVNTFANLFKNSKDYRYLYQQAVIYNEAKNAQGFDSLVTVLLEVTKTDSVAAKTLIDFPSPSGGAPQMVPMDAATLFLRGKFNIDKGDFKNGIPDLVASIKKFEPFDMPRYYLQEIEMMQRRGY